MKNNMWLVRLPTPYDMAGEKVRHFDSAVFPGCRRLRLLVGKDEGHPETAEEAGPPMLILSIL